MTTSNVLLSGFVRETLHSGLLASPRSVLGRTFGCSIGFFGGKRNKSHEVARCWIGRAVGGMYAFSTQTIVTLVALSERDRRR